MKYIKISFSLLFLALVSCKKVVDIKDTDFIGGAVALQTVTNTEQGIIGAYAGMSMSMGVLLNSYFADEVKRAEFYNAATTHEWTFTSSDVTIRDNFTAMIPYYKVIDRVNRVLVALPAAKATKAGDDALRLRLEGEALFMRAYSHFELYRFYCANYTPDGLAMPYITEPTIAPQARIKMSEYFQKMSDDIAKAKTLLPNNLTDVKRATRLAATGLQARIALYKMDWPNAITFSTEYISAIPLASKADFKGIWLDENNQEVAFKIPRDIGSLWYGRATTTGGVTKIGTVTWAPSDKLYNSFDQVNDIRFKSYLVDEPLLMADAGRQTHLVKKYPGTGYTTSSENVGDSKVFRTGEMYLIRAEARAETNLVSGANSAESDLNVLRAARITGYTNVTLSSKQAAIDAIMQERFKELAYEGHRFWDLRRKGLPVQRLLSDAPTSSAGITLPASDIHWLLPIPDAEMKANKLMVQNPGYAN